MGICELDLHGVRHPDVDRIVENYVLMNTVPLRIITGRSNKMRFLVTKVLKRHSFKWDVPSHNVGMLTVFDEGGINANKSI